MKKDFILHHTMDEKPSNLKHTLHIHDYYELYYVISGDISYYIEGQTYKLHENELLIMNPKELHRPFFNSDRIYDRIVIHFKPEYISYFNFNNFNLLQCFEKRKLGSYNKFSSKEIEEYKIDKYFKAIEKYENDCSETSKIMVLTYFVQMLVSLNKIFNKNINNISNVSSYNDTKIISILEFINNNLSQKITLDLLEKNFYINKFYLCHTFKKNTGFTVKDYITYKRIIKAKELLSSGLSVMEVSNLVGFNDYSNFYKTFKKIVGVSPKQSQNKGSKM